MAKKVFAVYLAKEDVPNSEAYATLELPASPWELWDAMEKVRLKDGEALYMEIDDYYAFEYLAPHLEELDISLNELNDLAALLSALDEVQEALPNVRLMILEPFVLPGTATKVEEEPARWSFFASEVPLRAQAARRVAERHGATFIPLQARFDEACRLAEPGYWLRDGVHPTPMGHELIAREWMKAF